MVIFIMALQTVGGTSDTKLPTTCQMKLPMTKYT